MVKNGGKLRNAFIEYLILPWIIWGILTILPLIILDEFVENEQGVWTQLWGLVAALGLPIIWIISYVKSGFLGVSNNEYVFDRFMFAIMILHLFST